MFLPREKTRLPGITRQIPGPFGEYTLGLKLYNTFKAALDHLVRQLELGTQLQGTLRITSRFPREEHRVL